MLFGIGFMIGSPALLLIFAPIFVICSLLEFKFIEEPELEKRLGETHREYKRKAPILIPISFRSWIHANGGYVTFQLGLKL